jgi:hypothetical protein
MGQSYVLWRTPLPTCPSDIHRSLDQVGLRGACWRDVSIELGGKGSFQAVKLQRPARTTGAVIPQGTWPPFHRIKAQ